MKSKSMPEAAPALVPPAHLAEHWTEDSPEELAALAKFARSNPRATAEEVARRRFDFRTAIAERRAEKARKGAARLADLNAASTCPVCGTVGAVRVTLLGTPPSSGGGRGFGSVAEVEAAAALRRQGIAMPNGTDDDARPIRSYVPEPGQAVQTPLSGRRARSLACDRCRPIVEAAVLQILRADVIGDSTRGELADRFALRLVDEHAARMKR